MCCDSNYNDYVNSNLRTCHCTTHGIDDEALSYIDMRLKNILDCPESSCRKRFKFNKCIKFKSSAFQFSFKIDTNFPDNPIHYFYVKNISSFY